VAKWQRSSSNWSISISGSKQLSGSFYIAFKYITNMKFLSFLIAAFMLTQTVTAQFVRGDIVEWTNEKYPELTEHGEVNSVSGDNVNLQWFGNGPITRTASTLTKATPNTGKFAVGDKIAVVTLDGYETAVIRESTKEGYRLGEANIDLSIPYHEKNLYKFDEANFLSVTKGQEDILDKLQYVENNKLGYLKFTGAEIKPTLTNLAALQNTLQPFKLTLPLTPIYEWKKNPNYTLYLLQQHKHLIYVDVCDGDTVTTASQRMIGELEALPTDYAELYKLGGLPGSFLNLFTLKNGFAEYEAKYKDWKANRADCLAALGKSEVNDFTPIKALFDKKAEALMNSIKAFSSTYKMEMNAHNAPLEALAKAAYIKDEPGSTVLKTWLVDPAWKIKYDAYNIPEYKYLLVHILAQTPRFKTQLYMAAEVVCMYEGGGKYSAPKAKVTENAWNFKEYLIGR
jgi:hypothetical protein